jgi:Ni/Co efflux regulator RcnB
MKTLLVAMALALALVGGVVTSAQADHREQRYERRDDHRGRGHRHDSRRDRRDHWDHRDGYRLGYAQGRHDQRRYNRGHYVRPAGYHYRTWRYGDYLPSAYCSRRYIVHDYDVYRLHRPPRGYHWVRVDNDVFLAAIAGGLVVAAAHDIFY